MGAFWVKLGKLSHETSSNCGFEKENDFERFLGYLLIVS